MSDTWSEIQEVKSRQSSLREKLLKRKKEREGLVAGITGANVEETTSSSTAPTEEKTTIPTESESKAKSADNVAITAKVQERAVREQSSLLDPSKLHLVEKCLQEKLCDVTLNFPLESSFLAGTVEKALGFPVRDSQLFDLLEKLAAQQLISIETKEEQLEALSFKLITVVSADHNKLSAVLDSGEPAPKKRRIVESVKSKQDSPVKQQKAAPIVKPKEDIIESLLSTQSAKERENTKVNEEILELLSKRTAKEVSLVEKFKSVGGVQVQEFCQYGTKEECVKTTGHSRSCGKLHFKKIIHHHTDESLGDCSFLNTCFHMDTCKYVHYEIDYPEKQQKLQKAISAQKHPLAPESSTILFPAQWIQCDLRWLDMSVLGKFAVVMADPPWDIHMELPYGTMQDDEMRKLPVPTLQDNGYIFLWVTGRAMELGRECLRLWGYERCDEIIWVKTNQLQRIIRTGRTGHWLNHGKEHCLVGAKGNLKNINRGLDCDVIVAEVRATSHKPDEIYGIIERLAPGTRKIELFGRPHNIQPNWVTLGNQVDGVRLLEPEVVKAFKKRYPDGDCLKPPIQQIQAIHH